MARRKIEEVKEVKEQEVAQDETSISDLGQLIDDYGYYNDLKKSNDKITKDLSAKIKERFSTDGLTDCEGSKYTAKISVATKTEFDEDKLLDIVKGLSPDYRSRLIITKEVVDIELLERMITNEEIQPVIFQPAQVTTTTTKLLCNKIKRGGKE